MENSNNLDQYRLERAKKRVKAISGFYRHLIVYLLVNVFLIALKSFSLDGDEKFFSLETFATAFFWGIGLAFHALGVFSENVLFGREWEERKIREIMEKEQKQHWE